MLEIVLVRPGATEYDLQGRIQGTLDIPLSDKGLGDADRLAAELREEQFETIYCAPCQSAWQTAEALGQALNLKPKRLDQLRNLDHGLWQGMRVDDVRQKQPKVYRQWQEQPEMVCPPGGEMLGTAQDRVRQLVSKLIRKHRSGRVCLVAPEPLASVICNVLRKDQLVGLWHANGHGRWETIPVETGVGHCD